MGENKLFVSVVIDNYNYGRFLPQCIQSALAQDYPQDRFEIILVDDGSTDDSLAVAARFGNRIRIIRQPNSGQPAAFNAGIAAARGGVVMFLDADDYWDRRKISLAARGFADPSVGIVQNLLTEVDAEGRAIRTPRPSWPGRYRVQDYLAGGAVLCATTALSMRKSVLEAVGPIPSEMRFSSDMYLLVHGLFESDALNISEVLGFHRVHGRNNWADNFSNPQKLRMGLEIDRAFRRSLDAKARARALEFSPFFVFLHELDRGRREILLAMHEKDRRRAWGLWRQLWKKHARTRLGRFRCATLLLALASVPLYLRVYGFYENASWPARLRRRWLPEKSEFSAPAPR